MSNISAALENAVAEVLANRPEEGSEPTRRQRANTDRAFQRIMQLIAPRIRHFTRQYGLTAYAEDAEQACAIGVHRAITDYDPEKARFTTFVNWQLRGELQALRYRLMTDQRSFAKKVSARTVSLDQIAEAMSEDGQGHELMIEDEYALDATEASAANHMATRTADTLVDLYVAHLRKLGQDQLHRQARRKGKRSTRASAIDDRWLKPGTLDPAEVERLEERLQRDREIIRSHLLDDEPTLDEAMQRDISRDRIRQIGRRGAVAIAQMIDMGETDTLPFMRHRVNKERAASSVAADLPPLAALLAVGSGPSRRVH